MHASVFCTADVLVYREHFVYDFRIEGRFGVVCVRIPQIVPAGADKRVERIGIAKRVASAVRAFYVHELIAFGKR